MYNDELKQHVDELFRYALRQAAGIPALREELSRCYQRLQQPMRVAIVGKIKAGKSTFMNALLEEQVVETGAVETTFNVNWLLHGRERSLTIYYKDKNRSPEPTSYEKLGQLTRRSEDPEVLAYLRSIQYIRVTYPNDILCLFDLIDTPGLESVYEDDAKNTLELLMSKEMATATQDEAANADAIIYLFSKGLSASDDKTLQEFQGDIVNQARPFNAIGVLTKADTNWRAYDDPVEGVQAITKRLISTQQVRKLFYTILPVAGLLGLGAKTLTREEFTTLLQVATLPMERFSSMIQMERRFTSEYADVPIPGERRKHLIKRLGQYGVSLAYKLINKQGIRGYAALKAALYEHSGLPAVRKLILSHFGNRAYLIKLSRVLNDLELAFIEIRSRVQGKEREVVADIAGKFQMIRQQEHAFEEIAVLGNYYENKLAFSRHEGEDLLQVTGEYGLAYHERLGMPKDATLPELLWMAQTRLTYWKEKMLDCSFDRDTRRAAQVIAQSYNRLAYELSTSA